METILANEISIAQSGTYGKFDLADDGLESEASGKRTSRASSVSGLLNIYIYKPIYIYI